MAITRHRFPAAPRARRPLAAAVALVALAGCQAPAPATTPPAPTSTRTAAVSSGTPSASPTPPDRPAELRRIAIPEANFDESAAPLSSVAMGNAIDPPLAAPGRPSTPVRVSDKGVQPSANAKDTVYVGCHTSTRHGPEQYPCDVLTRRVQRGMHVVATTAAGTLTYTVTQTRSIPYADFAGDEQTWRVEPRRLVFVMCDIVDGAPTHANYVIYATLN